MYIPEMNQHGLLVGERLLTGGTGDGGALAALVPDVTLKIALVAVLPAAAWAGVTLLIGGTCQDIQASQR
jgi:hypothetical protein